MSCDHDCTKPPVFPRAIFNRPGLEEIDYRIGMYDDIRAYLLDRIDKRPELGGWTHRGADDPGIALLEAGAIAADILTFYQQLYANEAFLRTADWQESVFELVRLTGYRPAPGTGAFATFAAKLKSSVSVAIPAGFGIKVKLEGQDKQSEFESTEEVTAWPHLGEFNLYRPRLAERSITPANAGNQLELKAVDGFTGLDAISAVDINAGDRIMLVPPATMFDVPGTAYTTQALPEILVVAEVERLLDRVLITFEGALVQSRGTTVDAYVLGRTFRHFGFNSPPQTTVVAGDPQIATLTPTRYVREIWGTDTPSSSETGYYSRILMQEMPLDKEVDDLPSGGKLICEGTTTFDGVTTEVRFTVVRTITEVRSDTLTWGNTNGATTVATLDKRLIANTSILNETADIRKLRFHEVASPRLTMRAPTAWTSGAFTDTKLNFFGSREEAEVLQGRELLLKSADGTLQDVAVQETLPSLASGSTQGRRMWEIELDRLPVFTRDAFDEISPSVTVYGNLVPATQGKTEEDAAIGSGDARQEFQMFPLPKSPLTYLVSAAGTAPELDVYVENVLWTRVESLFGARPDDRVYVVREDDDGVSFVQFGNGAMGARLPSGRNNVRATYRSGSGATGNAEKDPQAAARLTGLDKIVMPGGAAGGSQPETQDVARIAAPGRLQSLGRLVSLSDFEAEALGIPGVLKARAYWSAPEGVAVISIVVLTEGATDADLEFVRETINEYNRCRGPARHAITVTGGIRRYLHVALTIGYDPARLPEDVEAAVKSRLGIGSADGLFSLANRTFGQSAHVSQIVGHAQNADGVRWVVADAARVIPAGTPPETDPTKLAIPAVRVVHKKLICAPTEILALDALHFELNLVADVRQEVCS